jgi:hypothetical protein
MPENGVRSTYSQCPFQILMHDDNGLISTGTGFFYRHNGLSYFLTNWHNLSGKNPYNCEYLNKNKRVPTYLEIILSTYLDNERVKFEPSKYRIEVYSTDRQSPLWFEHPIFGSNCDIVALELSKPDLVPPFMHNFSNEINLKKIPVIPGNIAYIIGYPSGLSVGFGLPIWKSGYIASEPHYHIQLEMHGTSGHSQTTAPKLPAFFLDTLTRQGMSGSPVFAKYTGTWNLDKPYASFDPASPDFWESDNIAIAHSAMEFVGIYSGRIPTTIGEAALGICWNIDAINLVCSSRKLGTHPNN